MGCDCGLAVCVVLCFACCRFVLLLLLVVLVLFGICFGAMV